MTVAAYRNDIMHEVDLIEDIAIAYGYHNIKPTLVPTFTAGQGLELNWRGRRAAAALCGLGFTEVLSLVLTNERDHFEKLRREVPPRRVTVANPASSDQTMLRTNLYSCLLELLSMNTDHPLPQRVFEVGDVATYEGVAADQPRARELRVIAGALCASRAGYADGRSALDALLHELGYHVDGEERDVEYRPADNPSALAGRSAAVYLTMTEVGSHKSEIAGRPIAEVFEVHPEVLGNWKLGSPVVLFSLVLGDAQYH